MREEKYSCKEVVKLLSDYIDGECSPDVDASIKAHLADCPNCIAFVNTFRKSLVMSKALQYSDIPKDLRKRLHRVLEREVPMEDSSPGMHHHPFDRSGRTAEDEERI